MKILLQSVVCSYLPEMRLRMRATVAFLPPLRSGLMVRTAVRDSRQDAARNIQDKL